MPRVETAEAIYDTPRITLHQLESMVPLIDSVQAPVPLW